MKMRMSEHHKTALEGFVDAYGLCEVLSILAEISNEKAEHLRTNWQDVQGAKVWERDARVCDRAAGTVS
jgi:hypothetical protein